jgi:transposase
VPAPGQAKQVAMLGSLDHVTRQLIVHTSKLSRAALAARAHWLTVEWLPKYAPELNDIEPAWRDLKTHHLAHHTFQHADALDQAIHAAVQACNQQRRPHPLVRPRISA